ncbi:UvrD-helicase domain-containing protein [Dysgonomonas massiliensis]|uniref:UvrD-helicase domain-containing protein n=1 Tax=Dysgonomonas massiliensis TaxID=2040292 RepID=UPI000C78B7A4|nr:UvrD-helicase domain-containing protein [Dysgonomonas massiliensis]
MNENNIDDWVDDKLIECLNLERPKSFFLFAGAGAGKTRSLINVLKEIWARYGSYLKMQNKQIAVITYTNAATNEIINRLTTNDIDTRHFHVSTLHSFAWDIIKNYTKDIKDYLSIDLQTKIEKWELEESENKNKETKTSKNRLRNITKGASRIDNLKKIKKFKYDPNGKNSDKNSLSHEEVIFICSSFIKSKSLFKQIITQKYPIILIDESQDTKKDLIEALFSMEEEKQNFSLGLFGDMMQRIYQDGKEDLSSSVSKRWERPMKLINHRSQKRIVELINKIRFDIDGIEQKERAEKQGGLVRLFIFESNITYKDVIERRVREKMKMITEDDRWLDENEDSVKTLILEHHMAATRLGFNNLFQLLNQIEKYRQGLRDGTLSLLNFFIRNILPLIEAFRKNNKLEIARHVANTSPLLMKDLLKDSGKDQLNVLKEVNKKVNDLLKLWDDSTPTIYDILINLHNSKLYNIPNIFLQVLETEIDIEEEAFDEEELEEDDKPLKAWSEAFKATFDEVEKYNQYISGNTQFATHQGVKGLEYDRVIGILDDQGAKGFLFSYEKLFGVQKLTDTDLKNIEENKDSSINRTKRLLYVVCSRAKESLALIAYTKDIEKLRNTAINNDWFSNDEILLEEDLEIT